MPSATDTVRALAASDPDRVAIRLGEQDTTYAELDAAVGAIAGHLVATLPEHAAVALLASGSLPVAETAIAVARAGMVLVPVDPTAPEERVRHILDDSGAAVLLVEDPEKVPADIRCPAAVVADLVAAGLTGPATDLPAPVSGLQMLGYTSGSTGTPKAVMARDTVNAGIERVVAEHMPTEEGAWAALSAGSIGSSIILVTIGLAFGRMVCPIEVRATGLAGLADLIRREQASNLIVVPTVLRFWLPTLEPGVTFPSLKSVSTFGEAQTGEDHNALAARLAPDATIFNAYGSTEAGFIAMLAAPASETAPPGPLPVGFPVEGVDVRIVDEDGEDVPAGTLGEIRITSEATALGYWQRPELTRSTFEEMPGGRRIVRTGDQGYLRPDGALFVTGRSDHVVKVSGNRVDLGDVEHALRTVAGVQDAAVAARVDAAGTTTLHGYVVPLAGEPVVASAVRVQLARRLPSWMLPVTLTELGELPRLPNGKVDRRSLPEPAAAEVGGDDRAPTGRERELLEVWREVLDRPDVGLEDDFFVLGGDSMGAAMVMAILAQRHDVAWPVSLLVEAPTVAALAADMEAFSQESVIVAVRPAGDLDPLVVVHGGYGEGIFAAGIAEHIDPERPVYALRLPEDVRRAPEGEVTLEALAARYVEALRQVQPDGPYRLFGYSAGGVVACEMVLQLEASGQVVESLVLGDSPAPGASRAEPDTRALSPARRRVQRARKLGVLGSARRAVQLLVADTRHRSGAGDAPVTSSAAAREAAERRARESAALLGRLIGAYRPASRPAAAVTLVRSNLPGPADLGWSPLVDRLEIVPAACGHYAMVREPFLAELGVILERQLAAAAV